MRRGVDSLLALQKLKGIKHINTVLLAVLMGPQDLGFGVAHLGIHFHVYHPHSSVRLQDITLAYPQFPIHYKTVIFPYIQINKMSFRASNTARGQFPSPYSHQPPPNQPLYTQPYPSPQNVFVPPPQQPFRQSNPPNLIYNSSPYNSQPIYSQVPPRDSQEAPPIPQLDTRQSNVLMTSMLSSGVNKKGKQKAQFFEEVAYKIAPAQEDKLALDVRTIDGKDIEDQKGNLILYDYHGGPNQNFYFKKVGENQFHCKYNIINAATGFTLEVPNDSTDSIQLHMDPRNNGQSEIWELIPYPGGLFKIRSFCGKVLHADASFLRNETKVIQEVEGKERKQLWKIIPC